MGLCSGIRICCKDENSDKNITGSEFLKKFVDDLIENTGDIYFLNKSSNVEHENYELFRNGVRLGTIYDKSYYYDYQKAPYDQEKEYFNQIIYPLMLAGGYECEILDDYDRENNKTFSYPSSAYKTQNSLKDKDFNRYIDSVMNEYQKIYESLDYSDWRKCDNTAQKIYDKYLKINCLDNPGNMTNKENNESLMFCKPFMYLFLAYGYGFNNDYINDTKRGMDPKQLCELISKYNNTFDEKNAFFKKGIETTLQGTAILLETANYPSVSNLIKKTLNYAKENNIIKELEENDRDEPDEFIIPSCIEL